MLGSDTKYRVINSVSDLGLDLNELDEFLLLKVSEKMDEREQIFHPEQKLLLTAFCACLRRLCLSSGKEKYDLKSYATLYQSFEDNKNSYITTGVFLLAVIRDLMGESCDEDAISAWGEIFLSVCQRMGASVLSTK